MTRFKSILFILFVVFTLLGVNLYSTPAVCGYNGELTMPVANTFGAGALWLGGHFVTGDPSFLVNLGLGITEEFEISGAFDADDHPMSPFFHMGAKYAYYNSREAGSAIGVTFQLATGSPSDNSFTVYHVISEGLRGFQYSLGLGYTFGNDSNINYWMGLSKELFGIKNLWFETDFSNFPYRAWGANFANVSRGVVNMGIRVYLFDRTVRVDFASLDVLDTNREYTIGANILLSSIL